MKETLDLTPTQLQTLAGDSFRKQAPLSAADASRDILDAVRGGVCGRAMIGEDAKVLFWISRLFPGLQYYDAFMVLVTFPWAGSASMLRRRGIPGARFIYPSGNCL